jgi:multidrug resistance efflux pump
VSGRTEVFRKSALERLSSPEELDELLQVTRLRGWLLLAAVGLLLSAAAAWSVVGAVPLTTEGAGVLVPARPPRLLLAPRPARITSLAVEEGDPVTAGQPLLRLQPLPAGDAAGAAGAARTLAAPAGGRVYEVLAAPGDRVAAAQPLLRLGDEEQRLAAMLFVPASAARLLAPGMPVRLSVEGGTRLTGTVATVAALPLSPGRLTRLVEDAALARRLAADGPRVRVDVRLDPRAVRNVGWTARMAVEGSVVRGEERPIAFVVPWLRGAGEGS